MVRFHRGTAGIVISLCFLALAAYRTFMPSHQYSSSQAQQQPAATVQNAQGTRAAGIPSRSEYYTFYDKLPRPRPDKPCYVLSVGYTQYCQSTGATPSQEQVQMWHEFLKGYRKG